MTPSIDAAAAIPAATSLQQAVSPGPQSYTRIGKKPPPSGIDALFEDKLLKWFT